jgi:hypothetical protein
LVFSEIRLIIASGEAFQESISTSTQTGVAPVIKIARAQLMIVKLGMITSSPGFKSKALKASSSAAVPLETEIPNLRLW